MLLRALRVYEKRAKEMKANAVLPKLLMIVTGKGPLRYAYMKTVAKVQAEEQWEFVRCVSLWVEAADYPLLLGGRVSFTAEEWALMGSRELRPWDFFTFEHVRAGPTNEDRGHVWMSFTRLCAKFRLVSIGITSSVGFN